MTSPAELLASRHHAFIIRDKGINSITRTILLIDKGAKYGMFELLRDEEFYLAQPIKDDEIYWDEAGKVQAKIAAIYGFSWPPLGDVNSKRNPNWKDWCYD